MSTDRIEPFLSNWAYLKAELSWLDRVLSLAIAKHRQEAKAVDRVARSPRDRATSHWWKGLVSLEGATAADSPADLPRSTARPKSISYQQQLEAKVLASRQHRIALGLPTLCQQLQLSSFEKNLLLIALAPEINQRYSRLYRCLQDGDGLPVPALPTVDLVLRLLCRTDADWRSARQTLTTTAPLRQLGLLDLGDPTGTLLMRTLRLVDPLVDYLLAEQPDATTLSALLPPCGWHCWCPPSLDSPDPWADLVLPPALLSDLRHLGDRVHWGHQAALRGTVVCLVGAAGTGKTTAARAIAHSLQQPLHQADLQLLTATAQDQLEQAILRQAPPLLLLQSAQVWFGRSSQRSIADLLRLIDQRRQSNSLTLLSVASRTQITPQWQRRLPLLLFPRPDVASRVRLWQRAFPDTALLAEAINWQQLAQQFQFTGGEIHRVARTAAAAAAAAGTPIQQQHLLQACGRSRW